MGRLPSTERGISLVEALVALAIMAFGTLAVLGVQTTLRFNSDIAKQRGEAVRIAQETLEAVRASVETLADYDAIVSAAAADVAGYDVANTTYQVAQSVVDAAEGDIHAPRRKAVVIDVTWQDRTDQTQSVRLSAALQGTPPALAGSLLVNSDGTGVRRPRGRHPAVPVEAIDIGDGTNSRFQPPGAGVSWVFNNTTGFITQVCTGDACTAFNARLLAGFVRFSANPAAPSNAAEAENPLGASMPVEVTVVQSAPADQAGTQVCFETQQPLYVAYYCAVPLGTGDRWSGRSLVVHPDIVALLGDATAGKWRVCRYTPKLGHYLVPSEMSNEEHPLDYVNVRTSLVNQNFLMIGAGDGTTAFTCPNETDNTGVLEFIDGDTYRHQPAS